MRIAVVGLGIIGSIWARHWHADGHQVQAWNRTPKPDQPSWCANLAAAVADAELVALVLSDGPTTDAILTEVLAAAPADAIIAQHATIGVDETVALRDRVIASGRRYLDMPFTGSKPAAEQRQSVFFVGDDADVLDAVADTYAAVSATRIACGPVGKGATIKLCMNLMIAGTYQALAEGLSLARAAGIDDGLFFDVLDRNVARSGLVDLKRPKLEANEWSPQFAIKHLRKDLDLALRLGAEHGIAPPAGEAVAALYRAQHDAGRGELDFGAVIDALTP